MLLRVILIGVVAGLGAEPPRKNECRRLVEQGRSWCHARIEALAASSMPNGDAAFVSRKDPAPAVAVVETTPMPTGGNSFAAAPAPVAPESLPVASAEPMPMPVGTEAFVAEDAPQSIEDIAAYDISDTAPAVFEFDIIEAELDLFPIPARRPEIAMDAPDDLYPGLAYELNRDFEGLDDAAPAPAGRPRRVAEAVRLTAAALRAWVGVLQTPAVVSVTN